MEVCIDIVHAGGGSDSDSDSVLMVAVKIKNYGGLRSMPDAVGVEVRRS